MSTHSRLLLLEQVPVRVFVYILIHNEWLEVPQSMRKGIQPCPQYITYVPPGSPVASVHTMDRSLDLPWRMAFGCWHSHSSTMLFGYRKLALSLCRLQRITDGNWYNNIIHLPSCKCEGCFIMAYQLTRLMNMCMTCWYVLTDFLILLVHCCTVYNGPYVYLRAYLTNKLYTMIRYVSITM